MQKQGKKSIKNPSVFTILIRYTWFHLSGSLLFIGYWFKLYGLTACSLLTLNTFISFCHL